MAVVDIRRITTRGASQFYWIGLEPKYVCIISHILPIILILLYYTYTYMYSYVCIYIYTCIYIYIYTHVYIYIYVYIYDIHTYVSICLTLICALHCLWSFIKWGSVGHSKRFTIHAELPYINSILTLCVHEYHECNAAEMSLLRPFYNPSVSYQISLLNILPAMAAASDAVKRPGWKSANDTM